VAGLSSRNGRIPPLLGGPCDGTCWQRTQGDARDVREVMMNEMTRSIGTRDRFDFDEVFTAGPTAAAPISC